MEEFSLLYNINSDVSKNKGNKKKNRVTNFNISKNSMLVESLNKFFGSDETNNLREKYKSIIGSLNNDYLAAAIYLNESTTGEDLTLYINKCLTILNVPKEKKSGAIITLISYYYKAKSLNM